MKYEQLANNLLDYLVELHRPDKVCMILVHYGYGREELLELGFDTEDVDKALYAVGGEL